jgi:hypothetical protein
VLAWLNCRDSTVIVVHAESIENDHRVSDVRLAPPLSVQSAASVRDAAIAIRFHGVKHLPIVDDGCLVGIVAVREDPPQPPSPSDIRSDEHTTDRAGTPRHIKSK